MIILFVIASIFILVGLIYLTAIVAYWVGFFVKKYLFGEWE